MGVAGARRAGRGLQRVVEVVQHPQESTRPEAPQDGVHGGFDRRLLQRRRGVVAPQRPGQVREVPEEARALPGDRPLPPGRDRRRERGRAAPGRALEDGRAPGGEVLEGPVDRVAAGDPVLARRVRSIGVEERDGGTHPRGV